MKIQRKIVYPVILAVILLTAGCGVWTPPGGAVSASAETPDGEREFEAEPEAAGAESAESAAPSEDSRESRIAGREETAAQMNVLEDGMTPVYGAELKDGVYSVKVDSSSGMFRITDCRLTVREGAMNAVMTMGGTGYLKLYMGTGREAANASEDDYIPYVETARGEHTYQVPVEALDMGIHCAAFSKNKEKWYDRVLVFRSDSLPLEAFAEGKIVTAQDLNLEDGQYTAEVSLGGGSGRAGVESPARLRVENGNVFVTIVWGSSNYDYMKVGEERYELMGTEGSSTFEIPVAGFDWKIPVIADTIAMSQPHEISYTLTLDSSTLEKVQ